MRSDLRTVLTAMVAAALMVNPATACNYWGCGEVYVPAPCGCCGDPCEAVEVGPSEPCCMMGAPSDGGSMKPQAELPAPEPPASPSQNMHSGGEMLVPPQVPETHAGEPLKFEAPPAAQTEETPTPPTENAENAEELFGTPAAEPSGAEDLFGPSAPAPEKPAEAMEEKPAQPAAQPAAQPPAEQPAAPAESGGFDSLFGTPAETPSAQPAAPVEETKPADQAQPEEEKKEGESSFEDLFGQADKILQETGGLASAGMRRWRDNTGEYTCQGRLIDVRDGQIRLMKDNGRTSTVPFERLSKADMNFVQRQASAQQTASVDRTVHVVPSWPAN